MDPGKTCKLTAGIVIIFLILFFFFLVFFIARVCLTKMTKVITKI